jgi:hypothetical protein
MVIFPERDESRRLSRLPIMLVLIILSNVIVFLVELALDDDFILWYSMKPAEIVDGQQRETLFTSMFMHANFLDIFGNMLLRVGLRRRTGSQLSRADPLPRLLHVVRVGGGRLADGGQPRVHGAEPRRELSPRARGVPCCVPGGQNPRLDFSVLAIAWVDAVSVMRSVTDLIKLACLHEFSKEINS